MKPITINVSLPVYKQYKIYAEKRGRNISELIREAMEQYLINKIENKPTLKNLIPLHLKPNEDIDVLDINLLEESIDEDN